MTSISINRYISTRGNPRSLGVEPSSITIPQISTNAITLNETTAPTGGAGKAVLYMDSTDHATKTKTNSDTALTLAGQNSVNVTVSFTTPGGPLSVPINFTRTGNQLLMKLPQLGVTYASTSHFTCTLPVGYRPNNFFTDSIVVVQDVGSSLGRIDIATNGALVIGSDPAGNTFSTPGEITLEAFYLSYIVA